MLSRASKPTVVYIYDLLIEQGIGFPLPQSVCLKVDSILVSSHRADRCDKNQTKSLRRKIIKHQTASQGYYALYSTSLHRHSNSKQND